MEKDYNRKERLEKEYLTDLNFHMPDWTKSLIDLYTSPLKYLLKYDTDNKE